DMKHWSKYYALTAVYLTDDDVTTQDIQTLQGVPRLQYVLVNDEATTSQIVAPLRRDLTDSESLTEFDRIRLEEAMSLKTAPPPRLYQGDE
ncbi:MAG: hypothetical protein QGG71_27130, partial [Pirellulaceae bacterium]|nr:hypothetical protein [Pirellulaceae bacterium]